MKRSLLIQSTLIFLLIGAGMSVERDVGLGRAARMAHSVFAAADVPALDPPPTTHAVFTTLLSHIQGKSNASNPTSNFNGEITASDVFGDTPKNLYVYTYQQIFERPEQDAFNELARAYGLTPVDARAVLQGSVAPLMRGKRNYSQDRAIADVNKIQTSYREILRHQRMKYDLQLVVLPTEIFSNGNLDDSGFDLINDLNLIEEVLFIDKTKVYLNQQPFGPKKFSLETKKSGASSVDNTSGVIGNSSGSAGGNETGSNNTNGKASNLVNSGTSSAENRAKTYTLDDILKGSAASGGELNYCASGSPLNKALDQYNKTVGATSDGVGEGSGGRTSSGSSDYSASGNGSTVAASIENIDVATITPPELAQVPVASQGAFTPATESFCNEIGGTLLYTYRTKIGGTEHEIFCLSLDKKVRSYSSFSPTKSCIQCVVAAMNEDMKQLLSKNITPNKLTGNAYESTKCKSAIQLSDRLNMNIIMVPTPIITPNKYGPFVVGDIGTKINAYIRNYFPYGSPKDSPPERINHEAQANAGAKAEQVNVIDQIQSQIAINRKNFTDRQAAQPLEQTTTSKSSAYQQTIKEMRQMTAFFQSFQDIFVRLSTNAKGVCDKEDINS